MPKYISVRCLVAATTVMVSLATGTVVLAESDSENDDMMQVVPFWCGPYGGGAMGMVARPVDTDGDGIGRASEASTHAEFMAKAQASYEPADTNKDGKNTVWEFRAQQNPF
ncbi:hypothetical protein [Thioclava sp.]|uniref:hypothetical protein n=1 Tax=Thioclava sp. TaxID=1933450 RepID=UPI003AA7E11A